MENKKIKRYRVDTAYNAVYVYSDEHHAYLFDHHTRACDSTCDHTKKDSNNTDVF